MIHYHGTPITPNRTMRTLDGRRFCVSWFRPDQVALAHEIGVAVMLDCGAFSYWMARLRGQPIPEPDWNVYYAWCEYWFENPNTWAVVPDEIDAGTQFQDALLAGWPHGDRGAPVWHMDEPISRLLKLIEAWPRVCIGSTAQFRDILSSAWCRRMDEVWNAIVIAFGSIPQIHMLRGLRLGAWDWPFGSGDSTNIAQNHNRPNNTAVEMANRIEASRTPDFWNVRALQGDMFESPPALHQGRNADGPC